MEPHWTILPPQVKDRLLAKSDNDDCLPLNLSQAVMDSMRSNPDLAERLEKQAGAILDYFESGQPGWGEWPSDIAHALYVGIVLGAAVEAEVDDLILKLSSEELESLETECIERGVSIEKLLVERIIDSRKD